MFTDGAISKVYNTSVKTFVYKLLALCIFVIPFNQALSQDESTLTYSEYLKIVLEEHPIIKTAELNTDFGEASMLYANGLLDPLISASWKQKDFDKKLYYQMYDGKLDIPTRYGVSLLAGYDNTDGQFLNPQNFLQPDGLFFVGLEVDLLQGLLVNERSATLDKAEIISRMSENQRQLEVLELLYQAIENYFDWQMYYEIDKTLDSNRILSQTYLNITKLSFENGEKTAMDTLEAFLQYQDVIAMRQKNQIKLLKSRLKIENFLWLDDEPVNLREEITPENINTELATNVEDLDVVVSSHPKLLTLNNKREMLEVEQSLKSQKLLPKLKAKYNPLLGVNDNPVNEIASANNFTFGIGFSMPLLFRSARGDVELAEIKLKEIDFKIENEYQQLRNKINASWAKQSLLFQQTDLLQRNVEGYRALLDGERIKFDLGESTVFLVNKRQEKYIDSQIKLIKTQIDQNKAALEFYYNTNAINN
jgi:outer membrane protein TolC